ncbi:phosphoglycolate phosphatase [Piscinibacter sp.]|uniref:phosphoglycolate phosphatase n=1 Tax=Piscinibacter sp. TaxID=1903157 RepID=UPI0039E722A3
MSVDPSRCEAAIVDLDGTLVDTLPDFVAALDAMLAELGLRAIEPGFVARSVGKGSEHLLRRTLAEVGAPEALYERAWAAYQRHYRALNGRAATVYPGAAEGLQRLADAGWRLACVTNKPGEFARALLAATGLARFFAHTFGGDAFARRKPDPLPLLEACRALGSAPARTLMIGDSSNDAAAARAAGCPVLLVTYGYNHGEPVRGVDADGFVARLDDIEIAQGAARRGGAASGP